MPEFRQVYQSRALFHSSYVSSAFYHDPEIRQEVSEHIELACVKTEVCVKKRTGPGSLDRHFSQLAQQKDGALLLCLPTRI